MNGRPASEVGLAGLRELLRLDGTEVEIAVRTGFTMIMRRPSDAPAGKTELWIRDETAKKAGETNPKA